MNSNFPIKGVTLPNDFNGSMLKDSTGKDVDEVTDNNHLTIEQLKSMFAGNTELGKSARINLNRSIKYAMKKHNLKKDNLIENYHYFICPITNGMVMFFQNNHFSRFGINKERFLELFPEFEYCYTYAPYFTVIKNEKDANKPRKITYAYVNGKSLDLEAFSKSIKESYIRKYLKDNSIDTPIEGYHYQCCPITHKMVPSFNNAYFDKLSKHHVTKEDFVKEYPDVYLSGYSLFSRGYTLDDFYNGIHTFDYGTDNDVWTIAKRRAEHYKMAYSGDFDTRYESYGIDDIIGVINNGDDPAIVHYLQINEQNNEEVLLAISEETGISVHDLVEFHHYYVHPFTGNVCSRITEPMIKPFGISKNRFEELYPKYIGAGATTYLMEKIDDVKKNDVVNGKNSYQRGSEKRSHTMNTVLDDGLTIQEHSTMRSMESKRKNVDMYGRNGFQVLADGAILKSNKTLVKKLDLNPFNRYERIVDTITSKIRDFYRIQGYELARIGKGTPLSIDLYQLDHKYSITQGYNDKISPLSIAHIRNIEPLTVYDNQQKGNDCSITINELERYNHQSYKDMEYEFERIMAVINVDITNEEYHNTMSVLERAGHDIALKIKPYNDFKHFIDDKKDDIINDNLFDLTLNYYFPI